MDHLELGGLAHGEEVALVQRLEHILDARLVQWARADRRLARDHETLTADSEAVIHIA